MSAHELQHYENSNWQPKFPVTAFYVGHDTRATGYISSFQERPIKVQQFTSALHAFHIINHKGIMPEVIYSEYKLPGMSGLAFHGLLKKELQNKAPVFYSAF